MPLVTIGIPTFRRPPLLRRAVLSALAQDHHDLEVVVSDNASGDDTAAVCRELAAADPRVRYIAQTVNVGPAANFLAVLEAARGEYFMWLGDDDWIDPDYVSSCLGILSASSDVAVVGGIGHNYRAGAHVGESKPLDVVHHSPSRRVMDYYRLVEDNAIFYGVMRRSMLATCVLTNTLGGDWLLMAQIAFRGRMLTNPEVHFHRERANSTSRSVAAMVQALRVPRVQERLPILSIALAAARDVLRTDLVFGALTKPQRRALASAVAGIVLVKMGVWFRVRDAGLPILGPDRARRWKTVVARSLGVDVRP